MYWNNEELYVEPYERKQKKYFCGKTLLKIKKKKNLKFTVVIVDLSEAYCANIYDDGEIEKRFQFNSEVGNKHHQGGQSAQRFARIREQQITLYFKKINEKLKDVKNDFIVGINFIYRNRFNKHLSTENKNKLIKFEGIEYGGLTGCYQFRNMNI